MLEYLEYSLQDFLLFSREAYLRLLENYNQDLWPAQVAATLVGLLLIWLIYRRKASWQRLIWGLLAGFWAWIGYAFYFERYATINIAAPYFGALFIAQAALLFLLGTVLARLRFEKVSNLTQWIGSGLVVSALSVHPIASGMMRGSWSQAEFFGLLPAPTLIATFGFILLAAGAARWYLLLIALLLSAVNGTTVFGLDDPVGLTVLLAAGLSVVSMLWQGLMRVRANTS